MGKAERPLALFCAGEPETPHSPIPQPFPSWSFARNLHLNRNRNPSPNPSAPQSVPHFSPPSQALTSRHRWRSSVVTAKSVHFHGEIYELSHTRFTIVDAIPSHTATTRSETLRIGNWISADCSLNRRLSPGPRARRDLLLARFGPGNRC